MRAVQYFIYCCVLCGLCYESEEDVGGHLRMVHESKDRNPIYIRKRRI